MTEEKEESFWSSDCQSRLQDRVDSVMDTLVSTVPDFVTTEQVVDHIAAAHPFGAILPNHATKRVLDENGRPISTDKLFTQVEHLERHGSREIGATTETKTLAWWGIRDDNTPEESLKARDTVNISTKHNTPKQETEGSGDRDTHKSGGRHSSRTNNDRKRESHRHHHHHHHHRRSTDHPDRERR
eukprot:gb/GECG01014846.1/.p1 GENE.gb/GECG01014846.1/~~gb/GECG01014846.1/.p1  ORF type:complete len:185 (+),score=25.50 gb/GECG01014846.1/:1-555(+)